MRNTLVLAATACLVAALVAGDTPTLAGLYVVHRHGARMPVAPSGANQSIICDGDASLCGVLVAAGTEMLFSLGKHLVDEYGVNGFPFRNHTITPTPRGTAYNPDRLVTTSTDVDRTIQSAGALIRGVMNTAAPGFGNTSSSFYSHGEDLPVIHTKAIANEHKLLPQETWISLLVDTYIHQDAAAASMAKYTRRILTPAQLAVLGRAFDAEGLCADPASAATCALRAQDTMESCVARGVPIPADALALWPQVNAVISELNRRSMYNASKPLDRAIGTKGYLLATDMITKIQTALTASLSDGLVSYHHYSGHDLTLMAFSETLGNYSLDNTKFAGAFVIEFWRTSDDASASSTRVRVRYGEPNQLPDSGHKYDFFFAGLTCVHANGTQYKAPRDEGCTLDDFARFVATRGPTTPQGLCYLPLDDLEAVDCVPGNSADRNNTAPNPLCAFYRTNCPLWACIMPDAPTTQTHYLTPDLVCRAIGDHHPTTVAPSRSNNTVPEQKHHHNVMLRHIASIAIVAAVCVVGASIAYRFASRRRREYAGVPTTVIA